MDSDLKTEKKKLVESDKDEMNVEKEEEEVEESKFLLPCRRGGLSKKTGNPKLKVQWNDRNGENLLQILEFQPSDASDSDEEGSDSCMCRVM
ncbi:unnamed protein product [Cuscuta campestris]|uniref:Uncharacterized protein n=1 Tax=Cuscuta campestris TaxID=132261 RepID=A0A484NNW6_9ASTE|nr:unnamed protein product [Cuscuta campestris]